MSRKLRSTSVAAKKFATLQHKRVSEELIDGYPIWDNLIGNRDNSGLKYELVGNKWNITTEWDNTEWRTASLAGPFKIVDITSGSHYYPSLILQNDAEEFAVMTLDYYRTALTSGKLQQQNDVINGTFKLVKYSNGSYRSNDVYYMELV